jgi:beta-glucosidase
MKETRLISDFEDKMSAVIQCYLPGNEGGRALVDIFTATQTQVETAYPRYPNSLEKI